MPFTPPPVDSLVEEPKRKFTPPPANSLQAAPSKPAVTPSNAVSPDELEALQEKEDARQFGRENIGSEESEQGLARMVTEAKEHPAEIAKTPLALASLPFDMIASVLPHLTPAERAQLAKTSPNWEKAEAAAEAVGKVAPLLLPVGAIMEAGIVGKALGALFGASAASELPQESAATGAVFGNPKSTPGEKILAGTDLGTTAAIAALGLSGPALEAGKLLPQSVQSTLDAKKATEPFATPAPAKPRLPVQPDPEVKPEEKPDIMPPEAPSVRRGMTQEKWNTLQDWQKKNVLQMIEARKQAQAERIKPPQPAAPPTVQPTKTPFVPPPPTSVVAPPPKDETTPPTTPAASPVEAGTPPVPVEETGKAPTTAPPVPATPKETEELTEVDTVKKARAIALGEGTPVDKFRSLVALYDEMPDLKSRTAESKTKQQYSTPPPLAYLADVLADVRSGERVHEPTAGHGMLVIDSSPEARLSLNELDKGRAGRLRELWPSAAVTERDATSEEHHHLKSQEAPDRVVANPPFGSRIGPGGESERFPIRGATTAKTMTPSIDMAIAHSALDSMQPNGKASLILGAKTGGVSASFGNDANRARAYNRPELLDLFNRYKVKDWFTVGGNLYEKMGAGWPVDVIVIDGKGKTPPMKEGGFPRPWVTPPKVYSTWADLEGKLPQDESAATVKPGAPGREPGGSGGGVLPPEGEGTGLRPGEPQAAPPRFVSESPIGQMPTESERPQGPEHAGGGTEGNGRDEGSRVTPTEHPPEVVEQPAEEKQPGSKSVAGTGEKPIPAVRGDLGKLNTPYLPVSESPGEGGPTPISMGGRNPKDPGEIAESSLGQLSLSLQTLADSRKGSVRKAFDLGQQWAKTKDSVTSALSGLSAAGKFMQKRLVGKPEVTPLDESIGKRHLSLSESADIARRWVRTATKAMPDKELQAAISNWIDTGGDPALLQQGAAATKPQYRAGYERAMRLTPEERTIAENIKTHFEDRLDDAQREGILSDGIENYIHRMYERESPWKQGIIAELRSGLFTGKPALAKKRVFQYDFEAEKEGLAPVKSFIQRVAAYDLALNKAIADRQMVKDMMEIRMADGRPMISTAGWGTQVPKDAVTEATLIKPSQKFRSETDAKKNRGDYKVYDHPALRKWKWLGEDTGGTPIYLQGDALIHPDAVNRIHQLFDASAVRKSPVGRAALALSSTVKQTMLDLSGFHWVQVTVHGAEHRTFGPIKEIDWTNPDVRGLVSGGLVVGDTTGAEHFSEGLTGSSLTKFIPGLGPRLQEATHWLFNDYIPRLKVATGLHALERNRKRFQNLSDQELHRLTANEMNAAFGEQNYELLGRSKTMQDVLRLMFFSPDFTEARARFAGQAATWYGREQFTALALGAMALYVTARILNKYLDGQWHLEPKNAFNFVHNGKAYSLRTVQGDLVHAATDPNSFMFHRINPVFGRPVMEELTRRDEFGRKRTQGQIIEDFARNAIPISAKGFFNGNEQTLLESFMNSAGLTERRDSATEDVYDLAETWKKQNHVNAAPGEFIYDKDKDPYHNIRLAALNGGDVKKAIAQSGLSPSKVEDHFARSWQHAFAGSKANEAAFVRSLTEDQKALYQKAAQERKAVTERVLDALRK